MENLFLAAFIAVVAGLALFRLRQMLRWVRTEATFLGAETPSFGGSYLGQALPIAFRRPDGTEVRAALRNYSRGDLPRTGTRIAIRYDPDEPERAEWAASVPVLTVLVAVLLCILVAVLRRALHGPGLVV